MSNSDFATLLDHTPIAILVADENDNIVFTNNITKTMFGIDPQTSEEVSIQKFFSKYHYKWNTIKEKVITKGAFSFDSTAKKITGGTIEAAVHCRLTQYAGQPAYACYIRDISDQQIILREHYKEQYFRQLLLDSIPAMVFAKDTENRLIAMNKAYQNITGLNMDIVSGKKISDFIMDKNLAEQFWKDDLEVIQTGIPKRNIIEPLLNNPNRWFITDKIPYKTFSGEIIGVIGFSIEITERKNAEDALIESEKKFRLLFDTSPDGILLMELDGKIIKTNSAFRNMTGYTENELKNRSYFDIVAGEDKANELPTLKNSILFGDTIDTVERNYIKKDGNILQALVKGWIIKDQFGLPVQMGAFIKDLTVQKIVEKDESLLLESEKDKLEQELESKNRELSSKIAQLIEKTELFNSLVEKVDEILSRKPDNVFEELQEMMNMLQENKTEDFWNQFEMTFEQINKSFYDNIYERFPKLSNNEKRISAFLKMNMSTKDISHITHQSVRSIEMARTRLRKKLKLKRSDNLTAFLSQF